MVEQGKVYWGALPEAISGERNEKRVLAVSHNERHLASVWASGILRTRRTGRVEGEADAIALPGTVYSPPGEANCPDPALFDWFSLQIFRIDGAWFVDNREVNRLMDPPLGGISAQRLAEVLEVGRDCFSRVPARTTRRWLSLPRGNAKYRRGSLIEVEDSRTGWTPAIVMSNYEVQVRRNFFHPICLVAPLVDATGNNVLGMPGLPPLSVEIDGAVRTYLLVARFGQMVNWSKRRSRHVRAKTGRAVEFDGITTDSAARGLFDHLFGEP